jgi:UDP-N-acetylglucosamine transferase subunit ALG13
LIFVTVGAQMPFDRLVSAVDHWASDRNRSDVFAQIGQSEYRPQRIECSQLLEPDEFRRRCEGASAIVAHAGTGSIITALQMGKPIIIMPRRASLMETRNDHQVATAEQFKKFSSVVVAWNENELPARLDEIDGMVGQTSVGQYASEELLKAVRGFIDGEINSQRSRSPRI